MAFSGRATALVAPGAEGYLGVLPGHTPLVTSLKKGALTFVANGVRRRWQVGPGYMEVTPTTVIIITEEVEGEPAL